MKKTLQGSGRLKNPVLESCCEQTTTTPISPSNFDLSVKKLCSPFLEWFYYLQFVREGITKESLAVNSEKQ